MNKQALIDEIVDKSIPLTELKELAPLIDKLKDKKVVMLGEASHGTREFYEWRRHISNELIQHHGFSFIAVEGDWPSCEGINRYIQGDSSYDIIKVMNGFSRWPTWMWGNTEVMELMDDLRDWNASAEMPVGFHGLDVYSLYESLDEVLKRLQDLDPRLEERVKQFYACFEPYRHDERSYVQSLFHNPAGCEQQVTHALKEILAARLSDGDSILDVEQNARIIRNAQKYYHAMVFQDEDSWNVRDQHMMETLNTLLNHYGPDAKGIVWAHNTHIGDYRATDMVVQGQINIGGLARQQFGPENTALIGFSTYRGEVIASHAWDGPIEIRAVPESPAATLEGALHAAYPRVGHETFYLDCNKVAPGSPLLEYVGHRAIGVVYHPDFEHRGNYVPTIPANRYDGMIFCNQTRALSPLDVKFRREKFPETYPFGSRF